MEALTFLPYLADSWISEAYVRDTEALTKALQESFSGNTNSTSTLTSISQSPLDLYAETAPTTTLSDLETAPIKHHQKSILAASRKVSKHKSRASKRSKTTFIAADAANFRRMVQEVTGCKSRNSQMQVMPMPVVKPEPLRPCSQLQASASVGGYLPTLDTSSFLLDHHQQQVIRGSGFPPAMVAEGGGGLDFDKLLSFPTLDSGEVM